VRTGRTQRRSRRHPAFNDKLEEGRLRNEAWNLLKTAGKIASLDGRLGKGEGAKRQRAKLEAGGPARSD
jgi:hypothetical protein